MRANFSLLWLAIFCLLMATAGSKAQSLVPYSVLNEQFKAFYGYRDAKTSEVYILPQYESASDFVDGVAKVSKDGKYGCISPKGEVLIPFEYEKLGKISEGKLSARKNGKEGVIRIDGKELIPFQYIEVSDFFENCVRVKTDQGYQFLKANGSPLNAEYYQDAFHFTEGMAYVKKGDAYGYINLAGKEVISCSYEEAKSFENGIAIVKKNGLYGCIRKDGSILLEPNQERMPFFYDQLAEFEKDGKRGYLHSSGKVTIAPKYYETTPFQKNIAVVKDSVGWLLIRSTGEEVARLPFEFDARMTSDLIRVRRDDAYGIIDLKGNIILPVEYQSMTDFSMGVSILTQGQYKGCINTAAQWVVPMEFDEVLPQLETVCWARKRSKYTPFSKKTGRKLYDGEFEEIEFFFKGNVSIVMRQGVYGLMDEEGKLILPMEYEMIKVLPNDLLLLYKNHLYGCAGIDGSIIIPVKYSEISEFYQGVTIVRNGSRYGIIKRNGNELLSPNKSFIQPIKGAATFVREDHNFTLYSIKGKKKSKNIFQHAYPFESGLAAVATKEGWGYLGLDGKWVILPQYEQAYSFRGGLAKVKNKEGYGLVSKNGTWVVPAKYENIEAINDSVFAYQNEGLWGISTIDSLELIPASFENLMAPEKDNIWVNDGLGWFKVDQNGNKVGGKEDFSDLFIDADLQYVWTRNEETGHYGLMLPAKTLEPFVFDNLSSHIGRNRIFGLYKGTWLYLNSQDRWVDLSIDDVDYQLVAIASVMKRVKREGKYGFFNVHQEQMSVEPIYDDASSFSYIYETPEDAITGGRSPLSGYAAVSNRGKWGVIHMSGKEVLPISFDKIEMYSDGLFLTKKDNKWGYLDTLGQEIIPFQYEEADIFRNGIAKVKKDGKWGIIDVSTEEIVPCKYDNIYFTNDPTIVVANEKGNYWYWRTDDRKHTEKSYTAVSMVVVGGFLEVELDGLKGFVSVDLIEEIPPIYEEVGSSEEALIPVRERNLWGYIDHQNKTIIPFHYEWAEGFNYLGQARVSEDGQIFYIDLEGKKTEPKLDEGFDSFGEEGDW